MKKLCIFLFLILSVLISGVVNDVVAANKKTIGDLKKEINALKSKQSANNSLKSSTIASINSQRAAINNASNEIKNNEKEVENAKAKVIESEENIIKVTNELNDLFRFMQISNNQNTYLEYIANSSSVTDFIKRASIIEQLSKYQTERLKGLEKLIEEKKQLQVDLALRNEDLEKQKIEYQEKLEKLDSYLDELTEVGVSVSEEIKAQETLLKTYQDKGCKDNQTFDECMQGEIVSATGFLRPYAKGKVNSVYGKRSSGTHYGIDLGGAVEGSNVYATAAGVVAAIIREDDCGGNQVILYHNINGQKYTSHYAHLLSINVSVGQTVTTSTVVGRLGGGPSTWRYDRCTSGAHLHYTVATGYYLTDYQYSTYKIKSSVTGNASVIGIKNQKGWSWSTR